MVCGEPKYLKDKINFCDQFQGASLCLILATLDMHNIARYYRIVPPDPKIWLFNALFHVFNSKLKLSLLFDNAKLFFRVG